MGRSWRSACRPSSTTNGNTIKFVTGLYRAMNMFSASYCSWTRLSDEPDDLVEVELLAQRLADLVDDRELRRALVRVREQALGLVEQAGVAECHADTRRQRGEQPFHLLGELVPLAALEGDDPEHLVGGQDRHAEPRFVRVIEDNGTGRARFRIRPEPERPALADDRRGQALPEVERLRVEPLAVRDLVWERDDVGRRVVAGDEQRVGLVGLADPLADQLHDRREVQVLDEALPDLVDQGELHVALPDRVDRPRAGEGGGHVPPDEGDELDVLIRVDLALAVGLHDEHPDRPRLGDQRDPEPVDPSDAQVLEHALGHELPMPFGGHVLRHARLEHVGRRPPGITDAERLPRAWVGDVRVDLIRVVREVDGPALVVVQGDVEVPGVGQALEGLVDLPVERLEVLGGGGRLCDPDERPLDAQLALELGDARLERLGCGDAVSGHRGVRGTPILPSPENGLWGVATLPDPAPAGCVGVPTRLSRARGSARGPSCGPRRRTAPARRAPR